MKVHLGERIYVIEFQYQLQAWKSRSMFTRVSEVTTCLVRDAGVPAPFPVVAQATVTRYYRDTPNREKARKAALAKVLDVMFPPVIWPNRGQCVIPWGQDRLSLPLTRESRKAFWQVYLTRAQGPANQAKQQSEGAA